jgi:hypothetical protein
MGFDQPVADRDRVRVVLEFEVGSDPLVGSLQALDRRLDFSGWVGLASALEQAISAAGDSRPDGLSQTDAHSAEVRRIR